MLIVPELKSRGGGGKRKKEKKTRFTASNDSIQRELIVFFILFSVQFLSWIFFFSKEYRRKERKLYNAGRKERKNTVE